MQNLSWFHATPWKVFSEPVFVILLVHSANVRDVRNFLVDVLFEIGRLGFCIMRREHNVRGA